jgi:hypothetical protein
MRDNLFLGRAPGARTHRVVAGSTPEVVRNVSASLKISRKGFLRTSRGSLFFVWFLARCRVSLGVARDVVGVVERVRASKNNVGRHCAIRFLRGLFA